MGLAKYNGKVDLVTVIHTVHEFKDLARFLEQVQILLRKGGRMLVVEPRGHVTFNQFAAASKYCRQMGFCHVEPTAPMAANE